MNEGQFVETLRDRSRLVRVLSCAFDRNIQLIITDAEQHLTETVLLNNPGVESQLLAPRSMKLSPNCT